MVAPRADWRLGPPGPLVPPEGVWPWLRVRPASPAGQPRDPRLAGFVARRQRPKRGALRAALAGDLGLGRRLLRSWSGGVDAVAP